jgi:hypothetical protein
MTLYCSLWPHSQAVNCSLWQHFFLDAGLCVVQYRRMNKTQIIKIRVTPEEKAAFDAAVKAGNTDASKAIRRYVQDVVSGLADVASPLN